MATIVKHRKTRVEYVLLGAGFGMSTAVHHQLIKDLKVEKSRHLIAVCDAAGEILWGDPDDLRVVSVDGVSPEDCLREPVRSS